MFGFLLFQAEKSELEVEVNDLHEDIQALAVTSRTLTLCNILPLIGKSFFFKHSGAEFNEFELRRLTSELPTAI